MRLALKQSSTFPQVTTYLACCHFQPLLHEGTNVEVVGIASVNSHNANPAPPVNVPICGYQLLQQDWTVSTCVR